MATSVAGIVSFAVVGGVVVCIVAVIAIRALRRRHANPRYLPTPFLKKLWSHWDVRGAHQPIVDADEESLNSSQQRSRMQETSSGPGSRIGSGQNSQGGGSADVNRNTSVRSVMTLPAYRQKPSNEEQVLGREGERDGIDMVVELPTAEDEETLRDDEMEALYQIRLARRRQIEEREERRRQRREARERNDVVALEAIRGDIRRTSNTNTDEINDLRQEHDRIKRNRQRTASSVSYADVGIARHDGTRIRAGSMESERVGLLSDAGSIEQSRRESTQTLTSLFHRRDRSASSLSIETGLRGDLASPALDRSGSRTRSRAASRADGPSPAGSSPELIDPPEGDLGGADMPPHSPPGYDDVSLEDDAYREARSGANSPYPEPPPDYPGPTQARNNRLSATMADLADWHQQALGHEEQEDESQQNQDRNQSQSQSSSRAPGSIPRLPSLRLDTLPAIAIQPPSAVPRDEDEGHHR